MIIGGSKKSVINNIKKNVDQKLWHKKVEENDPKLTEEEMNQVLTNFFERRNKKDYFFKSILAKTILFFIKTKLNKDIQIINSLNIKKINYQTGAIITVNHFSPFDSFCIKKLTNKLHKKLYIVIQDSNLAMPKILGFLLNNMDVLPLKKSPSYINKVFLPKLKEILDKGYYVLIYPEEEMWYHYRMPRPCKRGAYQFASLNQVPIISCFIKLIDTNKKDNNEFNKLKYQLHILEPIYFDIKKSIRENSINMSIIDYNQKVSAYEQAYQKKLDYTFSYNHIAGYKKN